jgi:cholest-4-en-3-one 26-monooxygenase
MVTEWTEIDNLLLDPQWYAAGAYQDTFKILRDEDPVHWAEDTSYGKSYWAVTRHEDVKEYLLSPQKLSSRWDTRVPRTPKRLTPEQRHDLAYDVTPSTLDNPIHDLYRRPFNKHFSAPAIAKMRDDVERIVDEILVEAADKGGEIDIIEDLATPLPAKVILRLLGVPEPDWEYLSLAAWQWLAASDPKFTIDGDEVATSNYGKKRLLDYCAELALERKKNPQDDFATVITQMTVDGDELSIHELKSRFAGTIAGGMETTRNSAGTGLWLLMTHPDQRAKLLEDPSKAGAAVDEVMRWSTPAKNRLRIATEDFEWHGRRIRANDWVVAFLVSANWDERVFADPRRFDIDRTPNDHLSFGLGIHLCLGRFLARLELATFFTKVLRAFPDLEIVDLDHPKWIVDRSVTGFTQLNATFTTSNARIPAERPGRSRK